MPGGRTVPQLGVKGQRRSDGGAAVLERGGGGRGGEMEGEGKKEAVPVEGDQVSAAGTGARSLAGSGTEKSGAGRSVGSVPLNCGGVWGVGL